MWQSHPPSPAEVVSAKWENVKKNKHLERKENLSFEGTLDIW
jgi:hypothetical protein